MSEERYKCSKCNRTHDPETKIGKAHLKYKEDTSVIILQEDRVPVEESAPEEEGGIGGLKIGGRASGSPPTPPKREIPIIQKEEDTFSILSEAEGSPEFCRYIYWARDSCAACQGHRCAANSDKKLDPGLVEDLCSTIEFMTCVYYLKALETGVPQVCPYQGPPPEDKRATCRGAWCYADSRAIKVEKSCKKFWISCDIFARKKWAGVPFYRNTPKAGPEATLEEATE